MAVAPINSVVYPVSGGMEDWLYAAGWDRSELSTCDGGDARTTHLRRAEDPTTSRKRPLAAASHKSHRTSSSTRGKKKSSKAYAGRNTKLVPPDIDESSSSIRGRALAGRSSNASSAAYDDPSYDDPSENRAVVFLVETSDLKVPVASSLGGSKEVTVPYISLLIDLMIISIIIMIIHAAAEC